MMNRILIVEDDELLGKGVKLYFEQKSFSCETVDTYAKARTMLDRTWDMVILDQNLPDGSGMDLCKLIRKKKRTPIIFLTAKDTNADMVEGFEAGCDDYLAKPFDINVLYQRVLAVLRRSKSEDETELFRYEDLSVDFAKMQVMIKEELVKLSATEYKLLEFLIRNKGQVLTRDQILAKIWDVDENFVDENTLNVHIRRLRSKIEPDQKHPKYVMTVFGIGYTFGE